MATLDSPLKTLDRLDIRLRVYHDFEETEDNESEAAARKKDFKATLQEVCTVVREAERERSADLRTIIEKAEHVLSNAVEYSRSEESGLSVSSFAHSEDEPLIKDSLDYRGLETLDHFMTLWRMLNPGTGPELPKIPGIITEAPPWPSTPHPHPLTTRLSRFRDSISPSVTMSTPLAHTLYQARAQLTVDCLAPPCDLSISARGSILALATANGWKNRDPCLQYYLLGHQSNDDLHAGSFDPGFAHLARYITTDESRKLVFMADQDRVKSFSFEANLASGKTREDLPNVHTMNSAQLNGPLLILPSGRLIRTGRGQAAIWNLDGLETHQDHPGKLIGPGQVSVDDVWRDNDGDNIELSTGSVPTTTTSFGVDGLTPSVLRTHQPTGHVLFSTQNERGGRTVCAMADLDAGGRPVTRFIGHGGCVGRISTDEGNPNVFITGSDDGYARMFDIRHPLPVLTFDVESDRHLYPDVVLVHPDGVPTLFTGSTYSHQVKLWDIRARACVYELSTGNNEVTALAWDPARSSLFVATNCPNVDRMGRRMDYRKARIPRWAKDQSLVAQWKRYQEAIERGETLPEGADPTQIPNGGDDVDVAEDMEEDEEDDDWQDDDDDDYDETKWPKRTYHKEDHFGYAFDAGDHALFRWQFMESPDFTVLPPSSGFH